MGLRGCEHVAETTCHLLPPTWLHFIIGACWLTDLLRKSCLKVLLLQSSRRLRLHECFFFCVSSFMHVNFSISNLPDWSFCSWLLLSPPHPLLYFFQGFLLNSKLNVPLWSVLVQPSFLPHVWVCLVTCGSDTHLPVSYNNGLPHTQSTSCTLLPGTHAATQRCSHPLSPW